MNRWHQGPIGHGTLKMKKALGVRGSKALVRWLLLDRVQRPVGRVGVHPSTTIEQNTCRKLLKLRKLIVSHIGAI